MQSCFLVRDNHKSIRPRDVITFLQLFNSVKVLQCIVALLMLTLLESTAAEGEAPPAGQRADLTFLTDRSVLAE